MYYVIFCLTLLIISVILILSLNYTVKKIEGTSMLPTFDDGEWIIIKKDFELIAGNVYIYNSPSNLLCIKRLKRIVVSPINGYISLYFEGDNPDQSIDSRSYGLISPSQVRGVAIKGGKM